MTLYQILSLIGFSSILSGVIGWLIAKVKASKKENEALKGGVQALLRDRIIQACKYYNGKGYADKDDRENVENLYKHYHSLGANGVIDDIYNQFRSLPIYKKEGN